MNDEKTIINIFLKLKVYQRVFLIILILNNFFGYWFFDDFVDLVRSDAEFLQLAVSITSIIFLLPLLNHLPKAFKSVYQLIIVIMLVVIASSTVKVSEGLQSIDGELSRIESELDWMTTILKHK